MAQPRNMCSADHMAVVRKSGPLFAGQHDSSAGAAARADAMARPVVCHRCDSAKDVICRPTWQAWRGRNDWNTRRMHVDSESMAGRKNLERARAVAWHNPRAPARQCCTFCAHGLDTAQPTLKVWGPRCYGLVTNWSQTDVAGGAFRFFSWPRTIPQRRLSCRKTAPGRRGAAGLRRAGRAYAGWKSPRVHAMCPRRACIRWGNKRLGTCSRVAACA